MRSPVRIWVAAPEHTTLLSGVFCSGAATLSGGVFAKGKIQFVTPALPQAKAGIWVCVARRNLVRSWLQSSPLFLVVFFVLELLPSRAGFLPKAKSSSPPPLCLRQRRVSGFASQDAILFALGFNRASSFEWCFLFWSCYPLG